MSKNFLRDENAVPDINTTRGLTVSYENDDFTVVDSPTLLDVYGDLGRNGRDGYISNDGDGDITVEVSNASTGDYGGVHTIKSSEVLSLSGMNIARIRLTHVANTAYRAMLL